MAERIYIYDSMLRDGVQTQGVDVSAHDKSEIAAMLDRELQIDYIEGGWPGANPTDDEFFANLPKTKHSKLVAFGMTRRAHKSAKNDPGLNALVNTGVQAVCIVGKTWDFQVTEALGIGLNENIAMISDSIAYLASKNIEVMFDAEHFFDGYKANPDYAKQAAKAAYESGARWVVLCDTNGGTLPDEVEVIVKDVTETIPGDHLGIHCHNDTENAVANSLAAVRAGVRQVQGTINGWGERCGNANLTSLIPTLKLKMGYDVGVSDEALTHLCDVSHALEDRLNVPRYKHAAYVGASAFAHKGGLHVSAVVKNPSSYEHIEPEKVGNERVILVSDQAGRSNIINRVKKIGIDLDLNDAKTNERIERLVDDVKRREQAGYSYDSADASFELLAREHLREVPTYYDVKNFRVLDERRWNALNELVTFSEAKVELKIGKKRMLEVEEGNGPVNALYRAMIKGLKKHYPMVKEVILTDYKVRILTPEKATEAITRVQIESGDEAGDRWTTIGVSGNIIDASFNALNDSFIYYLLHHPSEA